jgi:recombination associated protein RdgC
MLSAIAVIDCAHAVNPDRPDRAGRGLKVPPLSPPRHVAPTIAPPAGRCEPASSTRESLPLFKNLIVHRFDPAWSAVPAEIEAALLPAGFLPCAPTQPVSAGWVAPRGLAHGALVEVIGGHLLLRLAIEHRVLPGAVVKRRTDERAAQIEHATGRKPGRKQLKELKDEALLDLLPQAFTKQATIDVWIAPAQGLLVIDAGSASKADEVVSMLVKSLAGLVVVPLHTAQSPVAAMSEWLTTGEPPAAFSVDRECELKSSDEMKSVVRYARHPLDTDEVRQHIADGKLPTRLALTWRGRVSFVLTDTLQVKKVDFLDVVFEGRSTDKHEAFDADAAIATGELVRLIPDLIDALGGEQVPGEAAAAPPERLAA